jgi:hypothetical protein
MGLSLFCPERFPASGKLLPVAAAMEFAKRSDAESPYSHPSDGSLNEVSRDGRSRRFGCGHEVDSQPPGVVIRLLLKQLVRFLEYFNNDIVHKTAAVLRRGRSTGYSQS